MVYCTFTGFPLCLPAEVEGNNFTTLIASESKYLDDLVNILMESLLKGEVYIDINKNYPHIEMKEKGWNLNILQKFLIILEMIIGFIVVNSLKGGKLFFKGKNIELNKFPLSETHFLPRVPLPFV